jgi:RNA polymerase sigma-70 factor (ECF subfamily)
MEGNETSMETLLDRYINRVYSYTYSLTKKAEEAEDITQETFLKVWKNLRKYSADYSFKTWIFTIARNTAYDYLRRKHDISFSNMDNSSTTNTFEESILDPEPLADEIYEMAEKDSSSKALLNSVLSEISVDQRTAIILHDCEDMTFAEIAIVTGKSMDTVKSHYRRGIAILRTKLHQNPDDKRISISNR